MAVNGAKKEGGDGADNGGEMSDLPCGFFIPHALGGRLMGVGCLISPRGVFHILIPHTLGWRLTGVRCLTSLHEAFLISHAPGRQPTSVMGFLFTAEMRSGRHHERYAKKHNSTPSTHRLVCTTTIVRISSLVKLN